MARTTRLRVVVIDDEPLMRGVVSRVLERTGRFELVGEADNGLDGVEMVLARTPDLVVCDRHMPGLDGLGVLRALSAEHCPSPVVIFSGDATAAGPALDAGAVAFVDKADLVALGDVALHLALSA